MILVLETFPEWIQKSVLTQVLKDAISAEQIHRGAMKKLSSCGRRWLAFIETDCNAYEFGRKIIVYMKKRSAGTEMVNVILKLLMSKVVLLAAVKKLYFSYFVTLPNVHAAVFPSPEFYSCVGPLFHSRKRHIH